jgi:hypothetical protein
MAAYPILMVLFRCCGGQAVVQMARSLLNGLEYAIKFLVTSVAFEVEEEMYRQGGSAHTSGIAQFLPEVRSLSSTATSHGPWITSKAQSMHLVVTLPYA